MSCPPRQDEPELLALRRRSGPDPGWPRVIWKSFELNRQLELDLPEADDHHTLAGFLLERLQHIPSAGGRHCGYNGLQFEITAMAGPRIERVRRCVCRSSEPEPGPTEAR